jgi:hypothetical protein
MHRLLWISSILFVIGAAIVYAEKAAEDRSAFIRWRHQVLQLMQGVNIYDTAMYPNPPIMPLTLYPLMVLPPVAGALLDRTGGPVRVNESASVCDRSPGARPATGSEVTSPGRPCRTR